MTDYSVLKRLAEAAAKHGWYQAGAFGLSRITGEAEESFVVAASPAAVLLLIADNERLTNRLEVDPRHDYDGISTRDATVKVLDEQVDQLKAENERLEVEVKRMTSIAYAAHGAFRMETMAERDQLRAEVAGLKTGYQAYERVNAELKAEVEGLRESNDKLTRRNGMLEKNVEVMTETHVLYTWLRKKVDQPSNDVVAVHMNIGHDWSTVHDLDTDLRAMIEREEP